MPYASASTSGWSSSFEYQHIREVEPCAACYYSERFTMSSNDITLTGKLPQYFMSNITLEKRHAAPWADLSFKAAVNNLFNEEYLSVLSRPMPGINFEVFVGITPKWRKGKK